MSLRKILVTIAVGLSASACGPALIMKRPDIAVVPSRMIAIPPEVLSIEVDADGVMRDLDDETFAATKSLAESINYAVSIRGGRYFSAPAMSSVDGMAAFRVWSASTLLDILGELNGSRRQGHKQVDEFQFTDDTSDIKEKLRADFVLIGKFLDGQNTTGRSVSNALANGFGGTVIDARREGLVCIVQLSDGRVVWCNRQRIEGRNVRERLGAQAAIDSLLVEILGPARSVVNK